MGRIGRAIIVVLALLFVVALGAAYVVFDWMGRPGPLDAAATIVLPKGAGSAEIAAFLAEARVIDNALLFRLADAATGDGLRAGEYRVEPHTTPEAVLGLIRSGRVVQHRLTVPEGLTSAEILALVAREPALDGTVDQAVAEGTLMPDTYLFPRGETRAALIATMRTAMDQLVAGLWAARDRSIPITTPAEAVTLASIVERETALAAERPLIARLFYNRLEKHMRLQSDPTVSYALTEGAAPLGRPLTRADLLIESPYNTYVVDGLPPGPIGNPGRAALDAVLHPAASDALYFVADGSGGHAFAATLAQHLANVARWRRIEAAEGR